MKKIFIALTLFFLITSCVVDRQQVGQYNQQDGRAKTVEKSKDIYLFWNMVPMRKTENYTGLKDYEKIVKRNAFDAIIYYGTLGIFSFYTVEIKAKQIPASKSEKPE